MVRYLKLKILLVRLRWGVAKNQKNDFVSIVNFMYVWGAAGGAPESARGGVEVIMWGKRFGHAKVWKREIEAGGGMRGMFHRRFCFGTYINFDTSRTVFCQDRSIMLTAKNASGGHTFMTQYT